MAKESSHKYKCLLVRRLKNKRIIGHAHKPEDSFLRFVKRHPNRSEVLTAFNELVKEGIIIRQRKNRGIHVSLTSKKPKYAKYLQ